MKSIIQLTLLLLICIFSFFSEVNSEPFLNFETKANNELKNHQNYSENNFLLDNAIYVIRNKNGDLNLDIEKDIPYLLNNPKKPLKKHFRIIAINKKTKKQTLEINSDNIYSIEDKDHHKRIGVINDKGEIGLLDKSKTEKNDEFINDKFLWNITPKLLEDDKSKKNKKLYFYLQNVGTGKYLQYESGNNKTKLACETKSIFDLTNNNYFILNRLYREILHKENSEILEKEPIDVLIKYIDLGDPNLKREGIKQIKKDEDNQELKYCVRSILQNIPWIRKIFILMPNERVRYFKSPEEIKDKIIYVKDKDLIGFDSASSPVFQFNLWRMKDFGMSENFILMDDDYFIGKPLKKSNFFYEENGQVYPALITRDYYEMSKSDLINKINAIFKKNKNVDSHAPNGFSIMQYTTLLFLYSILGDDDTRFGQPLVESSFTHNAIPVKQSDIKELYDYIEKYYPYKNQTLRAKQRETFSLQPQTLFTSYERNKYDRITKMISSIFFDLTQFKGKVKDELFVINTSTRKYGNSYFQNEIKNLEKLFPQKSPYELDANDIKKENNKKDDDKKTDNINTDNINTDNKKNDNKKNESINTDTKIESINTDNKNTDINKPDEKEKKINKMDITDIKKLMDYLDSQLKDKTKIKTDMLEIKNKINELIDKYNTMGKELETLKKELNRTIKINNETNALNLRNNNKIENSPKTKIFFIILSFAGLILFIYYFYRNGYFNKITINDNINYLDINRLNGAKSENEMSLMSSKIEI